MVLRTSGNVALGGGRCQQNSVFRCITNFADFSHGGKVLGLIQASPDRWAFPAQLPLHLNRVHDEL
jgi:hypothetical protein